MAHGKVLFLIVALSVGAAIVGWISKRPADVQTPPPPVIQSVQKQTPAQQSDVSGARTATAMRVGQWSTSYFIQPGCSTRYDSGNGTYYKVRFRYQRSEWVEHDGKGNHPADEIQFMPLKDGMTSIPFSIRCQ